MKKLIFLLCGFFILLGIPLQIDAETLNVETVLICPVETEAAINTNTIAEIDLLYAAIMNELADYTIMTAPFNQSNITTPMLAINEVSLEVGFINTGYLIGYATNESIAIRLNESGDNFKGYTLGDINELRSNGLQNYIETTLSSIPTSIQTYTKDYSQEVGFKVGANSNLSANCVS
jgi:hypothetical protein